MALERVAGASAVNDPTEWRWNEQAAAASVWNGSKALKLRQIFKVEDIEFNVRRAIICSVDCAF